MTAGRALFLASTLAMIGMVVVVTAEGSPAVLPAVGVALAYATINLWGVLDPRLAMFAPVMVRLPDAGNVIALTFDDGPHPTTTRAVLETLARFGVQATFFVLGEKVRAAPDVLREIARAGHTIGIHGDRHDRLLSLRSPKRIVAELEHARACVAEIIGHKPCLFRPPVGHVSPRTAVAARQLGLTIVGWSVRGRDGLARTSASDVERRVCAGVRAGAIVLLHDAAEQGDREPAGVAALPAILEHAIHAGLQCIALPSNGNR
jgi:peptidoglycan/xylan/chitin deacetylase (PgdA/CDA1 family)